MGDHHHGPAKGLSRWLFTTNHKDIGTMYLWFSFSMFLLGGFFAMIIRAELFQPGMQLIEPAFFNQMTTRCLWKVVRLQLAGLSMPRCRPPMRVHR